jgi:hypothetical protein
MLYADLIIRYKAYMSVDDHLLGLMEQRDRLSDAPLRDAGNMNPTGVTQLDLELSLLSLFDLLLESLRLDGPLRACRRQLQELELGSLLEGRYDVVRESAPVHKDRIDVFELGIVDLLGSRVGIIMHGRERLFDPSQGVVRDFAEDEQRVHIGRRNNRVQRYRAEAIMMTYDL